MWAFPLSPPMSGRRCIAPACHSCRLQSTQPFSPQTRSCCWAPCGNDCEGLQLWHLRSLPKPAGLSGQLCQGLRGRGTLLWSQHLSGSECECLTPTTSQRPELGEGRGGGEQEQPRARGLEERKPRRGPVTVCSPPSCARREPNLQCWISV